ncbi:hypothetical protein LCGC14_3131610 [marine sediment metagenome]|uniref:Uncharacterized protein n=1 Tax=marine sediment metagenome TaxID=412755 RepID=A0A0F8Y6H3_9ZZZZ
MIPLITRLSARLDKLDKRFNNLLAQSQRSELTGGVERVLFADKETAGQAGRLIFITDARKVGEGAAAGTGTLCYDDGTDWYRVGDDTVVAV